MRRLSLAPPTGATAEVSTRAVSDAIAARARCSAGAASRNAQAYFSQYPPGCSVVSIDRQHQLVARSSQAPSVTAPACRAAASASVKTARAASDAVGERKLARRGDEPLYVVVQRARRSWPQAQWTSQPSSISWWMAARTWSRRLATRKGRSPCRSSASLTAWRSASADVPGQAQSGAAGGFGSSLARAMSEALERSTHARMRSKTRARPG